MERTSMEDLGRLADLLGRSVAARWISRGGVARLGDLAGPTRRDEAAVEGLVDASQTTRRRGADHRARRPRKSG